VEAYVYELRRGHEVIGTGRFSSEERYAVGDPFYSDGHRGRVTDVLPLHGETRIVIQVGDRLDGLGESRALAVSPNS
jgi:hypothetical protein